MSPVGGHGGCGRHGGVCQQHTAKRDGVRVNTGQGRWVGGSVRRAGANVNAGVQAASRKRRARLTPHAPIGTASTTRTTRRRTLRIAAGCSASVVGAAEPTGSPLGGPWNRELRTVTVVWWWWWRWGGCGEGAGGRGRGRRGGGGGGFRQTPHAVLGESCRQEPATHARDGAASGCRGVTVRGVRVPSTAQPAPSSSPALPVREPSGLWLPAPAFLMPGGRPRLRGALGAALTAAAVAGAARLAAPQPLPTASGSVGGAYVWYRLYPAAIPMATAVRGREYGAHKSAAGGSHKGHGVHRARGALQCRGTQGGLAPPAGEQARLAGVRRRTR
jgi:hypothetical protein